jgi:hypothetical protein
MTRNSRDDAYRCINSIASMQSASPEPIGEKIIELFWCLSEARPDIDILPMIISEHETSLLTSCQQGKVQLAGKSVCDILTKLAHRMPSKTAQLLQNSCGVIDSALKTNRMETISDGLRDVVKALYEEQQSGGTLPVFVEGRSIRIGRHFKVSFCRTLRVPDDGKNYPLPAELGRFPLKAVTDYAGRVPQEWLETGGFFLPMYQSEAMFLEFEGQLWRPNIAKVGVGRINAVTGKPWDENIHAIEQDYVLCPQQRWLDGINAGQGYVRQFVAMPLGKGYTVEEQVTDECKFGGIQIAAFSARPGIFPEIDPKEIINAKLKPGDADLMAGILKLPPPYQGVLAMQVLGYSKEKILDALEVSNDVIERYERVEEERSRSSKGYKYGRGDGKHILLREIQVEGLSQLEPLIRYKDAFSCLKSQILPPDVRHQFRADDGIRFRMARSDDEQQSFSMGLAAGGRLKQKIIADSFGASTWNPSVKGSVFIHLVNSEVYKQITGECPPTRPMQAIHYQKLGVPWFSHYDDQAASVAPSRILSRIKSIFSLDQQRTNTDVSEESIWIDPQKIQDIKIPSAQERIEALVSATQAAFNNGAFKSVIRLTTSILDIQSDYIPAIGLRGEAHLQLGFYDEAKSDADHVLSLSQDSIAARCLRAKVALLTGSPEMALLEAKAALRFSDDDPTLALIIENANEQLLSK